MWKSSGGSLPILLAHHLHVGLFLHHQRVGRDAGGEEDVRANGAAFAHDGIAAHDGGAGVDGHPVLDGGMALLPAQLLAGREGLRHQAHP